MVDFNTHLDSKITSLQELTVGQLARAPWWEPAGRGSSPGTYIAFKEGRGPRGSISKKRITLHIWILKTFASILGCESKF
jgi:hypothetical protein